MDHTPAHRPTDWVENELRKAIDKVRGVVVTLGDLQDEGVRSDELARAEERLIEADLWLKRHGNRGRLGE